MFDGEDFLEPCPTCGHRPPAELPPGDPVTDVPVDRAAVARAHRTVAMLLQVLDQRRPAKHIADLVAQRVLRYLRAVPVEASGLRGGGRLLSCYPSQPHEGVVEIAGSVRLRGQRRALAASFTRAGLDRYMCSTSGSCEADGARRDLLARSRQAVAVDLARCAGIPRRAGP
ncbi:hypothetical protein GCM10009609_13960 [Pseudonocardia aurantiaca]|uniref:Rv3235 family protein n=1 Tax=Pseudonocardia aurantiaca TaxID=75290 RepID=A0ABW4FDP0_9PSEU